MIYKTDEEKMEVALAEAKKALEIDEIPVGAALFDEEHNLIFSAHNQRELNKIRLHMQKFLFYKKVLNY